MYRNIAFPLKQQKALDCSAFCFTLVFWFGKQAGIN